MTLGKRAKNILLATATTVVCLLIGIEVAAYLTVPSIHLTSEGDAMVVFDPEIGMVPNLYRVAGNQPKVLAAMLGLNEMLAGGAFDARTRL